MITFLKLEHSGATFQTNIWKHVPATFQPMFVMKQNRFADHLSNQ